MVAACFWSPSKHMALKLTPEQPETHGCVFSTVATDVQMLHVILLSSADQMSIALDQFRTRILHVYWSALENRTEFINTTTQCIR